MSRTATKSERTYHFPLCDRGKPCPNPEDTQEKINKSTTRFKPVAEANPRDEERGREE